MLGSNDHSSGDHENSFSAFVHDKRAERGERGEEDLHKYD
jgi:hypothetical protein